MNPFESEFMRNQWDPTREIKNKNVRMDMHYAFYLQNTEDEHVPPDACEHIPVPDSSLVWLSRIFFLWPYLSL